MKQRAHQFIKYVNKVYGLAQLLTRVNDGRINPQVPLKKILLIIIRSLVAGVYSFNMMEALLRQGYFKKLLKKKKPKGSADTFGYALARMDHGQLGKYNYEIIRTSRYNKVFQGGTIDGFTVVALDGTEAFRTQSVGWSCEKCRRTERTDPEGNKETDYHENVVGAAYVGRPPNLILGIERIAPGEGELTAARRLLKILYRENYRYADIITMDSLYAKAPVINEIVEQNKVAVIRVKQENYNIIKDAAGLFAGREPDLQKELSLKSVWYPEDLSGKKYTYQVEIWDAEGFESWSGVNVPLRILKIKEERLYRTGNKSCEPVVTYLVTTAGKATLPPESAWRILHRRWDIENKTFFGLKKRWDFGRNYHHDAEAFMVMLWLTVIAANLFYLFYYRRMHRYFAKGLSMEVLKIELLIDFAFLKWLIWDPG